MWSTLDSTLGSAHLIPHTEFHIQSQPVRNLKRSSEIHRVRCTHNRCSSAHICSPSATLIRELPDWCLTIDAPHCYLSSAAAKAIQFSCVSVCHPPWSEYALFGDLFEPSHHPGLSPCVYSAVVYLAVCFIVFFAVVLLPFHRRVFRRVSRRLFCCHSSVRHQWPFLWKRAPLIEGPPLIGPHTATSRRSESSLQHTAHSSSLIPIHIQKKTLLAWIGSDF